MQLIPSRIITLIAFEVLYSNACPLSSTRENVQIAITVVQGISTVVAITGVIGFARRMKGHLEGKKVYFKLFSFKLVVGLEILQSVLFSVLSAERVFPPTKYVSYDDFATGLEWFILTFEMIFVSIMFITAFEFAPYRQDARNGIPREGLFRAVLEITNPMDFIHGTWWMLTCFSKKYSVENVEISQGPVHEQREHKPSEDLESGSLSASPPPVESMQHHYP